MGFFHQDQLNLLSVGAVILIFIAIFAILLYRWRCSVQPMLGDTDEVEVLPTLGISSGRCAQFAAKWGVREDYVLSAERRILGLIESTGCSANDAHATKVLMEKDGVWITENTIKAAIESLLSLGVIRKEGNTLILRTDAAGLQIVTQVVPLDTFVILLLNKRGESTYPSSLFAECQAVYGVELNVFASCLDSLQAKGLVDRGAAGSVVLGEMRGEAATELLTPSREPCFFYRPQADYFPSLLEES